MHRMRVFWLFLLLTVGLTAALPGCSGGQPDIPAVDLSQLPPDQQILDLCVRGDMAGVKALVEAYPQIVNVRGGYYRTPLHFAAAYGHKGLVRYLIENGADPRAIDENSDSPAEAAAQEGHVDIVKIIREAQQRQ